MKANVADWLSVQADRSTARQRANVDTAKLIATFAAGVAAALSAASLQVAPTGPLDVGASVALAFGCYWVWRVVQADRLMEPDHTQVLATASSTTPPWNQAQILNELRRQHLAAVYFNEEVVRDVRQELVRQLALSSVASLVAATSMLVEVPWPAW